VLELTALTASVVVRVSWVQLGLFRWLLDFKGLVLLM
jgi:hypothetical protein